MSDRPRIEVKEIYLRFARYTGQDVSLPTGELLASGNKISFRPYGGRHVYGYETDNDGNIRKYYVDNREVSLETWKIKTAKNEDLRNSNFGTKPLYGMKNLTPPRDSRFLTPLVRGDVRAQGQRQARLCYPTN